MSVSLLTTLIALAAEQPEPDLLLPVALEHVRSALGADAAGIWCAERDGASHALRWHAGDARALPTAMPTGAVDVVPAAAPMTFPLRPDRAEAGTLALAGAAVTAALGSADARAALRPVVDFLAVVVGHVARAERLAAERDTSAAQADAQRRFAARVVDALPVGVHVVDRAYRVQLWNRKREIGTQGVAREDAIGRPIFEVLPRQNAALMREEFDAVFATGQLQQIQMESRSTGELRTYRLSKIPMPGDDGSVTHVITVGEDITEWKAALERSAQAEKLAAVGQLAAGVMHEINNPLATIAACAETMTLTLAELARPQQAPPGFGEYLRIIDHEVHRCRRIAEGLLGFSRAKPVERVTVGINAVAEQTLFLLKHHARFRQCVLRLDLVDGVGPQVTCDPDQLVQVVMALLLNAADAVAAVPRADEDEQPAVTLRTREDVEGAAIEILDEGVGIPRESLSKIFEPFYTTKPPGQGTGLGLAICYGIVRDHGGRIVVDSEEGRGSTFRVLLPAAASVPA